MTRLKDSSPGTEYTATFVAAMFFRRMERCTKLGDCITKQRGKMPKEVEGEASAREEASLGTNLQWEIGNP